jgi:hypothetical protein
MDDRVPEPAIDIEAIRWEGNNLVICELILGVPG